MRKSEFNQMDLLGRDSISSDDIDKLQAMYEQLNEDNESYKESLLVSPYCSKYDREKSARSPNLIKSKFPPEADDLDESLAQYIRPFNFQHLTKTQTKQKFKLSKEVDGRKKTQHSWEDKSLESKCVGLQQTIIDLRRQIQQKDAKINILEKQLSYILQANVSNVVSPPIEKYQTAAFQSVKSIKTKESCHCEIENFKKQIVFLTKNNQELYEEVYRLNNLSKKLQKVLNKSLIFGRELEMKLQKLEYEGKDLKKENQQLKDERRQMVRNYEEEIKLFMRMKQVWKQGKENMKKEKKDLIKHYH